MKRLFIFSILVLSLSLLSCAGMEKRIMNEMPGAKNIQNLVIRYENLDPNVPALWEFSVCYDIPLIGCIDGEGPTWCDVMKDIQAKYIKGTQ